MDLIRAVNTKMNGAGLFPQSWRQHWVSMVTPWLSAVAHQSGGWHALWPMAPSGSELKSKRRSRGSHQGVFRAATVTERWREMTRIQPLSSTMVGGSSKGRNQPGLHQTGAAQCQEARRAVTVAQNTVERQRYAWKRQLGFSSVFAKIPLEGLPIYSGFAPQSCIARIRPRIYL
jgi:hypothetical protein